MGAFQRLTLGISDGAGNATDEPCACVMAGELRGARITEEA